MRQDYARLNPEHVWTARDARIAGLACVMAKSRVGRVQKSASETSVTLAVSFLLRDGVEIEFLFVVRDLAVLDRTGVDLWAILSASDFVREAQKRTLSVENVVFVT
jgi:hypothetical protein